MILPEDFGVKYAHKVNFKYAPRVNFMQLLPFFFQVGGGGWEYMILVKVEEICLLLYVFLVYVNELWMNRRERRLRGFKT